MVVEVEADMERVLGHFNLLLQRGAGDGDHLCGSSDRSSGGGGGQGGGGVVRSGKEEAAAGGEVKERIARALRLYKDAAARGGGGWLAQVWAPARDGDRRVLATRGQPFVLASQCHRLFQYRAVSLTHAFPVGGGGAAGEHGLPGRVFDAAAPEWTPNVQLYGSGEYARISYALIYDIQGSLALPILDPATRACLAVLELVSTAPMPHVAAEVEKLCHALHAVALGGPGIGCFHHPSAMATSGAPEDAARVAMAEVSELLAAVSEAHRLPLAQAWVTCRGCSHLTTAGAPFHLATGAGADDARGFRDACAEHHLRRGHGLVGTAAAARAPGFCADVGRCSKDAYPLAHHARMYGLAGCVVLGVEHTNAPDNGEECAAVLELFLPPELTGAAEQKAAVDAIVATIRERIANLNAIAISDMGNGGDQCVQVQEPELMNDLGDDRKCSDDDEEEDYLQLAVDSVNIEKFIVRNADQIGDDDEGPGSRVGKNKARRMAKTEKSVSLEELQRYFSGSLKDAAKSIGVCPTTMKRICRQHGIPRWPFRKISKVNRSLDKMAKLAAESAYHSPATISPPPPPPPCMSSALGEASSHGSCQAPPAALQSGNGNVNGGVVTVKASYRGDIVRFRVPCTAGVAAVKVEVAKRLGLDVAAFEVKYLDDDHEWVLLSCDDDFQECLDVVIPALPSSSSTVVATQVVRLMVQEVADGHGSSCGSSE